MTISNKVNTNKVNKAGATGPKLTARQEAAALAAQEKKEKEQVAEKRRLQEEQEKAENARKKKEEKEQAVTEAQRQQMEEAAATAKAGSGGEDATMEETEGEKNKREEEEARAKREGDKKRRAEEHRQEEERAKAQREAQAAAAAAQEGQKGGGGIGGGEGGEPAPDAPHVNVNDFINDMNNPGGEDGNETEYAETERDEARSPPKARRKKAVGKKASKKKEARKSRKSKRQEKESAADKAAAKAQRDAEKKAAEERKEAAKRKEEEEAEVTKGRDPDEAGGDEWQTDDEGEGGAKSSLRSGRFSNAGSTPGRKAKVGIALVDRNHDHKYKGVFLEGSLKLTNEDDRLTEFSMKVRGLYTEKLKVDPHVHILPAEAGATEPVLMQPNEISINHTEMGANISVPGNASFQKRKPYNMEWADVTEDDMEDPVVKFSYSFSCDVHPNELIRRVKPEFERNGGIKLALKQLATHTPKDATVLWRMYKEVGEKAVLAELARMLENARDWKEDHDMETYEWAGKPVPAATIRIGVPHIPNQDTSYVSKMPPSLKHRRNAIHIVVDKKDVKHMQSLMAQQRTQGWCRRCGAHRCIPLT